MSKLSRTEELDFCYLLTLLPVLRDIPEYASLPELFSLVGHEALIDLCMYAGGETFRIPTLEELNHSIGALKWYYSVFVSGESSITSIPEEYKEDALKIFRHARIGD